MRAIRRPGRASPLPPPVDRSCRSDYWHGIDGQQPLRRLVIRELLLGIAQNVAERGVTDAARQLYDGRHPLAQHWIRYAEDHGVLHQRMAQQDPLDLDRGDVGPAADDDILLTAHEPQLVALTLPHQVAAVVPAIACRGVRAIWPDPIAHGHIGTTNQELTDFASWHVPAFVVHETNLGARRNPSHRARL